MSDPRLVGMIGQGAARRVAACGFGAMAVVDRHSPRRAWPGSGSAERRGEAGAGWLGRALDRVQAFEIWARRVTAVVFIGVGVYETARSTLFLL